MVKSFLFLLCSCFGHFCYAQSLSHSVIGAAGNTFSSPSGSLDWTIGELMSETYTQAGKILTQGFHQPQVKTADISFNISVYPNPVMDSLQIKISQKGNYRVEAYNMLGQKVMDENVNLTVTETPIRINLQNFAPAIYVFRIFRVNSGDLFSYKIEKD